MALRKFVANAPRTNSTLALFRKVCREVPSVLTIYDIDMEVTAVRSKVRKAFQQNAFVKDPRIIEILLHKGHCALQEAMLQHKTKSHILNFLDPRCKTDKLRAIDDDIEFAVVRAMKDPRYVGMPADFVREHVTEMVKFCAGVGHKATGGAEIY